MFIHKTRKGCQAFKAHSVTLITPIGAQDGSGNSITNTVTVSNSFNDEIGIVWFEFSVSYSLTLDLKLFGLNSFSKDFSTSSAGVI